MPTTENIILSTNGFKSGGRLKRIALNYLGQEPINKTAPGRLDDPNDPNAVITSRVKENLLGIISNVSYRRLDKKPSSPKTKVVIFSPTDTQDFLNFLGNRPNLKIPLTNQSPINFAQDIFKQQLATFAEPISAANQENQFLKQQALSAYRWFIDNGPFYGTKSEPSFRLAAEPIILPQVYLNQLQILGKDLLVLDSILSKLPVKTKTGLGKDVVFTPEPSWRLDIILAENGQLQANEIQVDDGADALMIGEQMAYGLTTLNKSTANALNQFYRQKLQAKANQTLNLAAIWTSIDPLVDPYISNAQKMAQYLTVVSQGRTQLTLLQAGTNYDPNAFDGVINCCLPPSQLPFPLEKILSQTNFSAIDNKGLFALIFNPELKKFWEQFLTAERFARLKSVFIPTQFIQDQNELLTALNDKNSVVKAYWTGGNAELLQNGQGVFGPWNDFRQKWQALDMLEQGFKFIQQKLITPTKITALLMSGNRQNLETVNWYNRICAKYVQGQLTATEMTLGPNIVPTKRDCCFAPVIFN